MVVATKWPRMSTWRYSRACRSLPKCARRATPARRSSSRNPIIPRARPLSNWPAGLPPRCRKTERLLWKFAMSTLITEECINCGACEPRCPNNAIYAGGHQWELDGESHPPIAPDIYYIVPGKCTECVGFFDHEECAAACPV